MHVSRKQVSSILVASRKSYHNSLILSYAKGSLILKQIYGLSARLKVTSNHAEFYSYDGLYEITSLVVTRTRNRGIVATTVVVIPLFHFSSGLTVVRVLKHGLTYLPCNKFATKSKRRRFWFFGHACVESEQRTWPGRLANQEQRDCCSGRFAPATAADWIKFCVLRSLRASCRCWCLLL